MKERIESFKLPEPQRAGNISIEETLNRRRSVRRFKNEQLSLGEVSQLLWAANGMTVKGKTTAPSAGSTYPLNVYLVSGDVKGLGSGVYGFDPQEHSLILVREEDVRNKLSACAMMQHMIRKAPATIAISATFSRTMVKYGDRAFRYVHQESGHAAQNVALQAVALSIGTVMIGAYSDALVNKLLQVPEDENILYLIPVGKV